MEQAIIELVKGAPWAAAMIIIVRLFLQSAKEHEVQRSADAKELGIAQREHELQMERIRHGRELEVNNLWATTVKNLMTSQEQVGLDVAAVLKDLKESIMEQYKNMGITQDLYKTAKDKLERLVKD